MHSRNKWSISWRKSHYSGLKYGNFQILFRTKKKFYDKLKYITKLLAMQTNSELKNIYIKTKYWGKSGPRMVT